MLAYKDIFGTIITKGNAKIEFDANKNLMDFLVNDVKRAKQSLNAAEKEKLSGKQFKNLSDKLEEALHTFRQLEIS